MDEDSLYIRALKFFFDANQMGLVDPDSPTQNYDSVFKKYENGDIFFSVWPCAFSHCSGGFPPASKASR